MPVEEKSAEKKNASEGCSAPLLRQQQAFDYLALDQMAVDDFVDIGFVDIGVPRAFGIDDDDGTFLAAVQTTRFIDAHFARASQSQLFDATFGVFLHFLRAARGATGSIAAYALVQAKENMVFKVGAHSIPS